jgi:hypothetical protein
MLQRTKLGLLNAFNVQFDGLLLSSLSFDAGHIGEAARMANAMFILLGPSGKNHTSIVESLGFRETTWLVTTANRPDEPALGRSPLASVQLVPYISVDGSQGGWIIRAAPHGHEQLQSGAHLSIEDWWGQQVLRAANQEGMLSRLQIAKVMRDRDGGAHLDSTINDPIYAAVLLRGAGYNYKASSDATKDTPVEGMIEATIRQMAYEALFSLNSLSLTAKHTLNTAQQNNGPLSPQFFTEQGDASCPPVV